MNKSVKKIMLMIGVCMSIAGANPQNSVAKAKSALPQFKQIRLENGLEVVVIPLDNKSGVIQTNVFYKVGSRDEVMGKSGIAHMLEHLSFKSTKNLKAGQFDEIVKSFGGTNNAATSFDYTQYYIKSSAANVDKSLELFSELMENLSLNDKEFQPERQVVAEERRWRTDNSPVGYLYFRFFNTAFLHHSYHWTPIGFMGDILGWDISDIREFYQQYYQPNNAIVVVAGDIEPKIVFESAKKHFSKIKNAPKNSQKEHSQNLTQNAQNQVSRPAIIEPAQDGYREVIVKKESEIEWLLMGYKIPNFEDKDQVALSALAEILSGGKSALLDAELVDKKNIASEVSASAMALKDSGIFMLMAAGNAGVEAKKLQKEILAILERVKKGKITQKELDKVKVNMRANFVFGLNKASSVAGIFGRYLVMGNLTPLLEYEDRFANLTLEDIRAVANKYFIEDGLTVAILKNRI